MTKHDKQLYAPPAALKDLLWATLAGRKFRLDCGHHITFGRQLANDLTLRNGIRGFVVICSLCGY
jgi:hypothetical protein